MSAHIDSATTRQSFSRLPIERRHVTFDYGDIDDSSFHTGNEVLSAFWVGLSATFPKGEAEFIRSVKLFENQITDPKLKAEIEDFAAQEAHHAMQHKKINQQFIEQGYRVDHVDKVMGKQLDQRINEWSPKKRLMRTVAAEHITAVFAHFALSHPQAMDNVPQSFRNLFLWHAIEEIEHKSVAFDVYQHCVGDMQALKRHYIAFVFIEFPMRLFAITRYLLNNKGHRTNWQERKGMWRFLFGKDGMVSSVKHLYWMFLKRGFHPWNHDDSALIEHWKLELSPYFQHSK